MGAIKNWSVGKKVISLRTNGNIIIAEEIEDRSGIVPDSTTEQFTIATGLPGLVGVIEILKEVADEIRRQRKMRSTKSNDAPE